MAKFMVLYNSNTSASDRMGSSSPEEMKAGMDAWMQWKNEAEKGCKFEFGLPLQAVNNVSDSGASDSSSKVSGYSMMEGAKDKILDLLKTHPHLKEAGNSIDLLEMLPMPGM